MWPDDYLEVALRIYGERYKGRILLVTDQGRARLDEDGWQATPGQGTLPTEGL